MISYCHCEEADKPAKQSQGLLRSLFPLAMALTIVSLATAALAKNEEEVEMVRQSEGLVVSKDHYLDIPQDKKVLKVASNVVKVEDSGKYVERRVNTLEAQVTQLLSRMDQFEERLDKLEKNKPESKNNQTRIF